MAGERGAPLRQVDVSFEVLAGGSVPAEVGMKWHPKSMRKRLVLGKEPTFASWDWAKISLPSTATALACFRRCLASVFESSAGGSQELQ